MFAISDKVVCIDVSPGKGLNQYHGKLTPLVLNRVYTVEDVFIDPFDSAVLVSLVGLHMGIYGFDASRFRKLSEVKAENALQASLQAIANTVFSKPTTIRIDSSSQKTL